jgi:Tol biopolymer transport system component
MHNSNSRLVFLSLLLLIFLGWEGRASPSGLKNKILFLSEQGICTINPDGTDPKLIVPLKPEERSLNPNPKWSPDKQRVAFTALVRGHDRIILVDQDGSNRKVLSLPETTRVDQGTGKVDSTSWQYELDFRGWSTSGKYLVYLYGHVLDQSIFGVISTEGEIVGQAGGSLPCFGGKDHLVYRQWYRNGGTDIFSGDLGKKEKRNLTNTNGETLVEFYPSQSPDGKMIVFQSSTPANKELWIMRSDGSGKKKLIGSEQHFPSVAWEGLEFSPDGRKIMFLPNEGSSSQIYTINRDGTGLKAITDKIVKASGRVSWSPDGKRIVFVSDKDGDDQLYIINSDGTGLTRLTRNTTKNLYPDW